MDILRQVKVFALAPIAVSLLAACGGGGGGGTTEPPVVVEPPPPPPPELCVGHPCPQPRPAKPSQVQNEDKSVTVVITDEGQFPAVDPFANPPGSNHLNTVYENMKTGTGEEMPNTLPSSPENPYNLHPEPVVTEIDKTSPTDDLDMVIRSLQASIRNKTALDEDMIEFGIDIMEGNDVDRVYSGLSMLHYKGPEKVGVVEPVKDADGNTIGGQVDVHQVWFDTHIEGDKAFIDPSLVQDVPWQITYTVDVLNRGHDDFAPAVMYFDPHPETGAKLPHVMMDQTFFPMEDGTRTVYDIQMSHGTYYNLTYVWGWRIHPPRVHVTENALKKADGLTLVEWEEVAFGTNPTASEENKLAAISVIGDIAPAKIMWNNFRALKAMSLDDADEITDLQWVEASAMIADTKAAFQDWKTRTKLPRGVELDPDTDLTILYANNTMYGEFLDGSPNNHDKWRIRPHNFKVRLLNGDHFDHAYMNVDFGGSRGWENQFLDTVDIGGAGPWFTFGRHHFFPNAGNPGWPLGPIYVPPAAADGTFGSHLVDLTLNFEPNRRSRLYQFDPLHHEVAVWTAH